MSLRLLDTTKYLWYFFTLYASWSPVQGVTVRSTPKFSSPIEAQAKFFQYRHYPSQEAYDQGHRLGSERHFTERHEKSRPSEGLFSAKVRWGDKKGGYGEHYWDLNHAGHAGNHGDDGYNDHSDDGSYHHDDDHDNHSYDGGKDHSPSYSNDDYEPDKSSYEENGRAKRAPARSRPEKRHYKESQKNEELNSRPKNRKNKEQLQEAPSHKVDNYSDEEDDEEPEEVYKKPSKQHQRQSQEQEANSKSKEPRNQVVLVVKEKDRKPQEQNYQNNEEYSRYVPYEGGAGVRQHHQPEVTAAASVPRLFLEPSTGHVVDRATGQAYVLQPIGVPNN